VKLQHLRDFCAASVIAKSVFWRRGKTKAINKTPRFGYRVVIQKGSMEGKHSTANVGTPTIEKRCRRCDEVVAKIIEDGQVCRLGRADIFDRTRIFCKCTRLVFTFVPTTLPDDDLTPESYRQAKSIRRSLALTNKHYKEANDA
jgi:hypothetical protein